MRSFLSDGMARLNHVRPDPLTMDSLVPTLEAYGAAISRATPILWQELEAMAEGADLSINALILLQIRRELMGYTRFPLSGDCTSMVRVGANEAVLAQTVDLTCEMQDHIQLMRIEGRDIAGGSAMVFTFTGLLGYLGMNAAGLAVGLNLVLAGEWRPGLPPYLAIRHLVDRAHRVSDALEILAELPLASSRNFVLCDHEEAAMVEVAGGLLRVLREPALCHANHYIHPDFVSQDEINVFARNSSQYRQAVAEEFLASHRAPLTPEAVMLAFGNEPINITGPRDMRREKTAATVIMEPRHGRLSLRRGNLVEAEVETHTLCVLSGDEA